MFLRESEMAGSVVDWMRSTNLIVKPEFVTPWGICDFVGLSFNQSRVDQRLELRQTRAIGSITRASLMLMVPDVATGKSVNLTQLVRACSFSVSAEVVEHELERLVADHFVVCLPRGRFQKVNGWLPLQKRLVAVELKLHRVDEALRQAMSNLGFADESYVASPVTSRIRSRRKRSESPFF